MSSQKPSPRPCRTGYTADDPDRTAVSQVNPAAPAPKVLCQCRACTRALATGRGATRTAIASARSVSYSAKIRRNFPPWPWLQVLRWPSGAAACGMAVAPKGTSTRCQRGCAAAPAAGSSAAAQATTSPAPVAIAATEWHPNPAPWSSAHWAWPTRRTPALPMPRMHRLSRAPTPCASWWKNRGPVRGQGFHHQELRGTGTQTAGTAWRVHQDRRDRKAPSAGPDGLVQTEARAVVKVRDVQKSLNQLSKENALTSSANGDPKGGHPASASAMPTVRNPSRRTDPWWPKRAQGSHQVLGFRVWSAQGMPPRRQRPGSGLSNRRRGQTQNTIGTPAQFGPDHQQDCAHVVDTQPPIALAAEEVTSTPSHPAAKVGPRRTRP